ncbi:MAG: hypothetical protein C4318_02160 [Acidimicrobiia bacterium]
MPRPLRRPELGLARSWFGNRLIADASEIWESRSNRLALPAASVAVVIVVLLVGSPAKAGDSILCDCWQRVRAPSFAGDYPIDHSNSAAAFDAARGQIVTFGGTTFIFAELDETWVWDGTNWTKLNPPTKPPKRSRAQMAYDPINQRIVMFGGFQQAVGPLYDTWEWDGTNWTMPSSANPPSLGGTAAQSPFAPDFGTKAGLMLGKMVWDPVRQEIVLFGGLTIDTTNFELGGSTETWVYKNGEWSKRNPVTPLPPRLAPAGAADVGRSQIIAFGGALPNFFFTDHSESFEEKPLKDQESVLSDTWSWDGSNWHRVPTRHSPPPRLGGAMADSFNDTPAVLFGGQSVSAIDADNNGVLETINGTYGDLWAFMGDDWLQVVVPGSQTDKDRKGAGARNEHFVVYDSSRREVIVAGGYTLGLPEETTATWSWTPPFGRPFHVRQYFAEGFTGSAAAPFDEWITLLNTGSSPAQVMLRYAKSDGGVVDQGPITVPPNARGTINVTSFLGSGVQHSTYVLSNSANLFSERPMYFDYFSKQGGHDGVGAANLARDYYFAEGYTGPGFDTFFTVFNPNWWPITVDFKYLLPGGSTTTRQFPVGARSRATFSAKDVVGSTEFSTHVHANGGLIHVEQPVYFDYSGMKGGSVNSGQIALKTQAYFAEGYTGPGFTEYLTLGNPQTSPVSVTLNFLPESGTPITIADTLPATSRRTYRVNDLIGPNVAHGTVVTSSQPIMSARPMYYDYSGPGGWDGGDVGVGISPSPWALFAEGYALSSASHPYITIANPNSTPVAVNVLFLFPSNYPMLKVVTVPANNRSTIRVLDLFDNREFSVFIISQDPSKSIVVERPQYFSYKGWSDGFISAGYNGTPPA